MPYKTRQTALVRPRHGLSSWVKSKKLPKGRAFQVVRRELSLLRDDLIHAHGGDAITPEARILVDSVIEAMGVQKILGLYVRTYGVLDTQAAKHGRFELSPIMGKNWVSYGNVVRQGLLALRELEKGRPDSQALTLEAYVEATYGAGKASTPDKGDSKNDDPGATSSDIPGDKGNLGSVQDLARKDGKA